MSQFDLDECEEFYRIREQIEPLLLRASLPGLTADAFDRMDELAEQMAGTTDAPEFLRLDREFHNLSYSGAKTVVPDEIVQRMWNMTHRLMFTQVFQEQGDHVVHDEHRAPSARLTRTRPRWYAWATSAAPGCNWPGTLSSFRADFLRRRNHAFARTGGQPHRTDGAGRARRNRLVRRRFRLPLHHGPRVLDTTGHGEAATVFGCRFRRAWQAHLLTANSVGLELSQFLDPPTKPLFPTSMGCPRRCPAHVGYPLRDLHPAPVTAAGFARMGSPRTFPARIGCLAWVPDPHRLPGASPQPTPAAWRRSPTHTGCPAQVPNPHRPPGAGH
ncbi:FCD domain-containing protein [Amycolatopsis jejuensis]|uniref:FCD domain-containing protein n=1 Tax=Amycolatopsis jejuensis TaxID=330084 RepID=UPI0012DFFD3B